MSIWQNWWLKLQSPADNVVAAVIVLVGVLVTGAVTYLVSASNRRHERRREVRDRVYQERAAVYLEAGTFSLALTEQDPNKPIESANSDMLHILVTKLNMYGTRKASNQFFDAVLATTRWKMMESDENEESEKGTADEIKEAKVRAHDLKGEFDRTVRNDIQNLRNRPRWIRIKRNVTKFHIKHVQGRTFRHPLRRA